MMLFIYILGISIIIGIIFGIKNANDKMDFLAYITISASVGLILFIFEYVLLWHYVVDQCNDYKVVDKTGTYNLICGNESYVMNTSEDAGVVLYIDETDNIKTVSLKNDKCKFSHTDKEFGYVDVYKVVSADDILNHLLNTEVTAYNIYLPN